MSSKPSAPRGFDLDRREAAAYIGNKPATLAVWAIEKRHLPYLKAGGRAWYRRADLDRFLASRVIEPEIQP